MSATYFQMVQKKLETQMWQNVYSWEVWIQDKMAIFCTIFVSFP